MGTKFKSEFTFNADADAAFALISDKKYLEEKNEATGGTDVKVDVAESGDNTEITVERTLPAEVPDFAKKFTGDTITTKQVDKWGAPDADGSRKGTSQIEFKGSPLNVKANLKLANEGSGSKLTMEFEAKASIPLVGGKLEKVVKEQTERAVEAEQKIIDKKLG